MWALEWELAWELVSEVQVWAGWAAQAWASTASTDADATRKRKNGRSGQRASLHVSCSRVLPPCRACFSLHLSVSVFLLVPSSRTDALDRSRGGSSCLDVSCAGGWERDVAGEELIVAYTSQPPTPAL